jgi:Mg2+/Co2+ transporter CorB
VDDGILIDPWLAAAVVLLSLLLSAFFSGGETALTAASKARMAALESAGDRRAGLVMRMLQARERLIGTMLIGNNIVNIAVASFMTSLLVPLFGTAGVFYATLGVAVLIIVFAEVMPKTVAIADPDRVALLVSRPVSWFVALFGPLTIAIEAFVRRFLRLFGIRIDENQPILSARDELRGAVDLMHREGGVVKDDRDMLGGILDLKELEVSDVMIHRTKMRMIDADLPPEEIVREVLASPYTRMPLWRESPENIVGVLHAKDILRALDAAGGDPAKLKPGDIMLEPWFVPTTNSLHDQLKAFLGKKTHFALVVDEYGQVMGLVTLEDILEEIVGDIRDEHDLAVQGVRPQADGSTLAEGSVPIRDLNRAMDWHLPDEEATTIAGLVIHEAQTIPEPGQTFTFHGFRFQVLRKSRNRITQIRIAPLVLPPPLAGEGQPREARQGEGPGGGAASRRPAQRS